MFLHRPSFSGTAASVDSRSFVVAMHWWPRMPRQEHAAKEKHLKLIEEVGWKGTAKVPDERHELV